MTPIDFFPPEWRAESAGTVPLCLATKSRNLGDALVLTPLARALRSKFPHLKLSTYIRGFNPLVFKNNPFVSQVQFLPQRVYGDDANLGMGHLIQQKEEFFGLKPSVNPKPEIFLTDFEIARAQAELGKLGFESKSKKPVCIVHPWGSTHQNLLEVEVWDEVIARYKSRYRFIQVGVIGHGAIQGCDYYYLTPKRRKGAIRRLFALISQAQAFLGIDSGPMHVARAFEVPSLIFTRGIDIERVFENRGSSPYYLNSNYKYSTLYEQNQHVSVDFVGQARFNQEIDRFLN